MLFPISWQKLGEGAKLCFENAITLSECIRVISEEYRSIASFLSILAMEETGKGIALMKNYEKKNDLTENEWKKISRSRNAHIEKLKIVHQTLLDPYSLLLPHDLSVKLDEIEEFKKKSRKLAEEVNKFKLDYLYVDWNEKENQWISPTGREASVEDTFPLTVNAIRLLGQKLRESHIISDEILDKEIA